MTWMDATLAAVLAAQAVAIYWIWDDARARQKTLIDWGASLIKRVDRRLPPDEVTAVDSVRTAHARIQGLERRVHGAERLAAEARGKADSVDRRVRQMGGGY